MAKRTFRNFVWRSRRATVIETPSSRPLCNLGIRLAKTSAQASPFRLLNRTPSVGNSGRRRHPSDAPVAEWLRTVQLIAPPPKEIVAAFGIRWRGADLLSSSIQHPPLPPADQRSPSAQCLCSPLCAVCIPAPAFPPLSGFLSPPLFIDSISSSGGALATTSL